MHGIIGNYILEGELGRGGMGIVYRATHRVLGRPAAIKVLLANTIEHRDRVERFFNEARAAMAIAHPGIVAIYDVGVATDERAYIAMELLAGASLAASLRRGPLPVRIAVDYATQIAEALAAAHEAGVIHRDLKPDNIIVQPDRRVKLVDWGIAKLAEAIPNASGVRTVTGALMGTPSYMSPEQCEGMRDIDARSDLYSLGCVIFAMLSGRPVFESGGTGSLIGMHLTAPPPPLRAHCPSASPALEAIVATLLAKKRDDRFQTARAVVRALAAPEVRDVVGPPGVEPTADPASPALAVGMDLVPAGGAGRDATTRASTPPAMAFGPTAPVATLPVNAFGQTAPTAALPANASETAPTGVAYDPTARARPAGVSPVAALPSSGAPPTYDGPTMRTPGPGRRRSAIPLVIAAVAASAAIAILLAMRCAGSSQDAPQVAAATADAAPQDGAVADAVVVASVEAAPETPGSGGHTLDTSWLDAVDAAPAPKDKDKRVGSGSAKPVTNGSGSDSRPVVVRDEPKVGDPPTPPQDAAPEPPDASPPPPRVAIHETVEFRRNDSSFTNAGRRGAADALGQQLRAAPSLRILVTGHAGEDETQNPQSLALARANAAKQFLVGVQKIDRNRFSLATSVDPPGSVPRAEIVTIDP